MLSVTFPCNYSFVSRFPEKFFFYNSKILAVIKTQIMSSQHHQKQKNRFLEDAREKNCIEIGVFVENAPSYLAVQLDSNKSL